MFTTTDPRGYVVTCTKEQWNIHVLTESSHTAMQDNVDAVKNTIENPVAIYKSAEYNNREVYFSAAKATYSPLYTKVIVEFDDNNNGNVVTTFPQKHMGGGIGGLVYINGKL